MSELSKMRLFFLIGDSFVVYPNRFLEFFPEVELRTREVEVRWLVIWHVGSYIRILSYLRIQHKPL